MARIHYQDNRVKLVPSFRELVEIAELASATFKENGVDEAGNTTGELRYNFFQSPAKLESSLRFIFYDSLGELTSEISDRYEKLEKLNLVTRHIVETQALLDLYTESKAGISHRNFMFQNLAESIELQKQEFTQKDVQRYLQVTFSLLKKLLSYLIGLKSNLEQIRQEEFELPIHLQPDPTASTLENPLANFEHLISKNGLIKLRLDFIPSEEDYENTDVNYDEATETKTYWQPGDEGEWEKYEYKLADLLRNTLWVEFNKSKDWIDKAITLCKSKKQIKLKLTLWIEKLFYLKHSAEKDNGLKKYEVVPRAVEAMIRFLFEKYGNFCPNPSKRARAILEKSTYYELPAATAVSLLPAKNEPPAFKWVKHAEKYTMELHEFLNRRYIADIELTEFHKVFSGVVLPSTYSVRWIDLTPNEKHINKKTLLYLFQKLIAAGFIDESFGSPEMIFRLTRYFKNDKGERFDNLPQSLTELNKTKRKTAALKEIDLFIKKLTS